MDFAAGLRVGGSFSDSQASPEQSGGAFSFAGAAMLVQRVQRNTLGRDIICGDVHGNFTGLRAALDAIRFDDSAGDRLFLVGDLVDRGPESTQALWWLSRSWVFSVRGNHEQMVIDHAAGTMDAAVHYLNGGAWFLALTKPERCAFSDAFSSLPMAIELDTAGGLVGIVHAECPIPDFRQLDAELRGMRAQGVEACCLWSRSRIQNEYRDDVAGVRAVVVGHTPMRESVTLGNHIYIDTMGWRPGGHFTLLDAATLKPAA